HFLFGTADIHPALVVVPGWDAVAPPDLARDAPVLDVVEPVEIRLVPVARDELDAAILHALDGRLGDALAAAGAPVRQHVPGQVDEPLVGQVGLDDGVGAIPAR